MVAKGQFLERPTLIPVGQWVLEGLAHRGNRAPGLLVVPPPPVEGGGMDHVVAAEIVWAAAREGHPTLRFNYRGVGASQGPKSSEPEALRADALAALQLLVENTQAAPIAIAALGGSASIALELAREHPLVVGVCFISPTQFDPSELLKVKVEVPILAIVGERALGSPKVNGAGLAAALAELGGEVELVPEADATFTRHLPQVGKSLVAWLARGGLTSRSAR